ncbi:hypothetical protein PMAYCL1PPCAC_21248, partial [Pristionchus mayeri]
SDEHECVYCFALSGYDPDELTLKIFTPDGFELKVQGISEWDMAISEENTTGTNTDIVGTLGISFVNFGMRITRRPVFWVSLVVVPTFLIGSLVMIGVFYGATTENLINNSIQLGLTTMMSMMVVVGILNDSLAKT